MHLIIDRAPMNRIGTYVIIGQVAAKPSRVTYTANESCVLLTSTNFSHPSIYTLITRIYAWIYDIQV